MSARSFLCLDPGERTLRAVAVVVDGSTVTIERALHAEVPSDVFAPGGDASDVEAYGRWIAETLRRASFPADGTGCTTIITLDREQAAIRRIDLPTDDPDELPEMARLAMQRETPVEAGALTVDVVALATEGTSTTVLIAAAPAGVVDRAKRLAMAAGRSQAVVSLRAFGAARLLAERSDTMQGGAQAKSPAAAAPSVAPAIAGIDYSGEAIELLILRAGQLVHSRGARVADGASAASEAKRAWTGFRLASSGESAGGSLGAAVLFGPDDSTTAIASALDRTMGASLERYQSPEGFRIAATVDRKALSLAWPLVGLALERGADDESVNLAAPRKAPDFAARRRLRLILGGGVLVLSGLMGWTLGNLNRQSFTADVQAVSQLATSQLPDFHRFRRDAFRLAHLRSWEGARAEWLNELEQIHALAPDPTKVVLDTFAGTLEQIEIRFVKDKWKLSSDLRISVAGEAKDRATADAFRELLLESGRYVVLSPGPDTEGGKRLGSPFVYTLRAREAPAAAAASEAKSTEVAK
jgi:hypothetical protein